MHCALTFFLLLVRHISVSFPFDKFGLIMEYKGACDSSKISYYSSEIRGLTQVHFIKVELDELSVASAFCEGFNTIPHVEGNMVSLLINRVNLILYPTCS